MPLSFLRLLPSAELAPHVENFWFMRGRTAASMPDGHRILPDGCMEFVFQLGDPFEEREPGGAWRLQGSFLMVGQMERRVEIRPTGAIHTVGVHFRPAGLAAFIDGDLSRFSGRIGSLEDAIGRDPRPLAKQLTRLPTPRAKASLLEAFLRRRIRRGDEAIAQAAQMLSEETGLVDLEGAAREADLSARQFRRRFVAAVGLTPKRFSRLIRFQRVFEQKRETDAVAWSQAALESGYYDQAHFNRDFRAFTGARPRDLLKDADPLTDFFLSVSSKTTRREGR